MRKLLTGELCAGKPHAQFGGRGGRESFPTPINNSIVSFARLTRTPKTLRIFATAHAGRYVFDVSKF
jgi:hypothetical protein